MGVGPSVFLLHLRYEAARPTLHAHPPSRECAVPRSCHQAIPNGLALRTPISMSGFSTLDNRSLKVVE